MATVSFTRPVKVNKDWGVKNFEYALEHPVNPMLWHNPDYKIRRASKSDIQDLKEKMDK